MVPTWKFEPRTILSWINSTWESNIDYRWINANANSICNFRPRVSNLAEVMLVKKSMLVQLYVGEDKNLNVCWWKLFCIVVKVSTFNFIHIHEQTKFISPTYISKESRRSRTYMLVYHQHNRFFANIKVFCQRTFSNNILHHH